MRYATPEDAERLEELEGLLFPDNCLNAGTLSRELRLPGLSLVVGDPIVGYILTREAGDLMDVTRLGVLEEMRGRGLGRRLLQAVLEHSPQVMLTVLKSNEHALALYWSVGFHIVGHNALAWVMLRTTSTQHRG